MSAMLGDREGLARWGVDPMVRPADLREDAVRCEGPTHPGGRGGGRVSPHRQRSENGGGYLKANLA